MFGIGVGLAESAKLNGLSVLGAGFALSFIIAFRKIGNRVTKVNFFLLSSLILIFASQFTWIALNPYIWRDPIGRTVKMFDAQIVELGNQANNHLAQKIDGIMAHIDVDTERIFQTYSPLQFSNAWRLNILFFLIGFVCIAIKSYQYFVHIHTNPTFMALLLVGTTASIPPLFTPLDWDRYFLLPVFFSTLFIAVGIGMVFLKLQDSSKNLQNARSNKPV